MKYVWTPKQQTDQLQKLHEILDLVWRINEETDHDVSYWLSGHVSQVEITIYANGFHYEKDPELRSKIYYDGSLKDDLNVVIKELNEWL